MSKSSPLRPSGLIGTPPAWEVCDAIGRGLALDLSDVQFTDLALDAGFTGDGFIRGMLSFYRAVRWEHQHDGNPF